MLSDIRAANNCTPGSAGCFNVPTQRQQDALNEQQCEQQANAAFGQYFTQESVMTTLLGGIMGLLTGGTPKGVGKGVLISNIARYDVKSVNYTATLQACRQASGIGGLAQAISFTP